jgi:hypothetical protein
LVEIGRRLVGATETGAPVDDNIVGVGITGGSGGVVVGVNGIGATLIAAVGGAGDMSIGADLKGATETGILAVTGVAATGALVDDVLTGTTLGDSVDACSSSSMIMVITLTMFPAASYVKLSTNPQSALSKSSPLAIKSLEFTTVTLVL